MFHFRHYSLMHQPGLAGSDLMRCTIINYSHHTINSKFNYHFQSVPLSSRSRLYIKQNIRMASLKPHHKSKWLTEKQSIFNKRTFDWPVCCLSWNQKISMANDYIDPFCMIYGPRYVPHLKVLESPLAKLLNNIGGISSAARWREHNPSVNGHRHLCQTTSPNLWRWGPKGVAADFQSVVRR